MAVNFQSSKDLSWVEQALLMYKAKTSKTKTASKITNTNFSPQPPIQTAGDNMLAANQLATLNVSVLQDKGSNTSIEPILAASVISYNNDQLANLDLWDGIFVSTSLLEIDKFQSYDAQNIM